MIRSLLIVFLLLSFLPDCGHPGKQQETVTSTEQLVEVWDVYHSLAPRGWEVSKACDALLFVSLQQIGLGEAGPLEDAQGLPGQWFRLPSLRSDSSLCDSDISRDMFVGLLNYFWHFRRLDLAEQLWDYGVAHDWLMGQERSEKVETRVIFTPNMIGLLAELIDHLGGEKHAETAFAEIEQYDTAPGFVSHLTLLHLHLRGSMRGQLSAHELDVLRTISGHMSQNPLVWALISQYTDGDQTKATQLLLSIWPHDRLPTQANWSEEWRLQRSDGDTGFLPGEGDAPHSGGDFLFAASIVLGRA